MSCYVIVMTLSQNIKKKEAGGAKARPMGGGLLPPPPGAKAPGLLPPPGGQQTVSAVQTNTGNHCAFVSNHIVLKHPHMFKQYLFKRFCFLLQIQPLF